MFIDCFKFQSLQAVLCEITIIITHLVLVLTNILYVMTYKSVVYGIIICKNITDALSKRPSLGHCFMGSVEGTVCSVAWIRTTPLTYETRMQPLHFNAILVELRLKTPYTYSTW